MIIECLHLGSISLIYSCPLEIWSHISCHWSFFFSYWTSDQRAILPSLLFFPDHVVLCKSGKVPEIYTLRAHMFSLYISSVSCLVHRWLFFHLRSYFLLFFVHAPWKKETLFARPNCLKFENLRRKQTQKDEISRLIQNVSEFRDFRVPFATPLIFFGKHLGIIAGQEEKELFDAHCKLL